MTPKNRLYLLGVSLLVFLAGLADTHAAEPFSPRVQADLLQATVRIRCHSAAAVSCGTGVIVATADEGTFVLTSNHVVENGGRIEVETYSFDSYPRPSSRYAAAVVARDEDADLACLKFKPHAPAPKTVKIVGRDRQPEFPFDVLSAGCAEGELPMFSQTLGIAVVTIAGLHRSALFIRTNREPFQGESGGPLVTRDGLLVGICSAGGKHGGLYCSAEAIRRLLDRARVPGCATNPCGIE